MSLVKQKSKHSEAKKGDPMPSLDSLFVTLWVFFTCREKERERESERDIEREREREGWREGGREGEGEREGQREPHAAADIHGSFLDLVKDLRLAQEEFRFLSVYEVQM